MSDDAGTESELVDAGSTNADGREFDDSDIPEEAFISPDESLVRDSFRDALISPDEPIEQDEGGVVVGMDGSAQHEAVGFGVHLEPEQVASVLEDVAAGLREHGTSGLRHKPGTPHFETVIKAYIAGYFSTDY